MLATSGASWGRDINTRAHDGRRNLRLYEKKAEGISLRPYTPHTYYQRSLVERYYLDVRATLAAPHRFFALLSAAFTPSTALTYGLKAMAQIEEIREDPKSKPAILWLKKRMAEATLKKAVPITPKQMSRLLSTAKPIVATTALIMWISAARHSDLKAAWLEKCFGKGKSQVACLRFGPWKSDPSGVRQATKALPATDAMVEMLKSKKFASYYQVQASLTATSRELTVHSIRRGAIQFLAPNYSPLQIAAITQHAAGQEKSAVHKYTPASMMGPLPTLQLQLASELWSSLSRATSLGRRETSPTSHGRSVTTTAK